MKGAVSQCRYYLALADRIVAGLDDDHLALALQPGSKTAGWLIGHLAITGDSGRRMCGAQPLCPREWRASFNPGSQPSTDRADYPAIDVMRETLHRVYSDLCVVAQAADSALLSVPNPYEPGRADFPSARDFVEYLMTGHLAYHLGQLSEWCAEAGLRSASVPGQSG